MTSHISALTQTLIIYLVMGAAYYGWGRAATYVVGIGQQTNRSDITLIWLGWAFTLFIFSPVVFCHFWFQCGTLRPYLTHPHVKGSTPDAASNRGSCSPGNCSCRRLPGPLRESVPVSTFPELFDGPDRPGQQKPDQHHPLCAGER